VSTYLKQRNFVRFYQGLGLTPTQLISPKGHVVVQKANSVDFDKDKGLLTLGVSSKLLNRLNTLGLDIKHSHRFINDSRATSTGKILLFKASTDIVSTNDLYSPLLELDNFQTASNLPDPKTMQVGPNNLGYNSYESSLVLSIRQVIILATLNNTNS
jgi:hypothetical protein